MFMTAVICTHNRPDLIVRAVRCVLANDHPEFELVVVDQSTTDATRQALERLVADHRNLSYVHTTRIGLSAAYNAAIARSTGGLLAFTDDDCVAPTDWLYRIQQAFESEPGADLLYGQVLKPAELSDAEGIVPTFAILSHQLIGGGGSFRVCGMGANFAARRSLFQKIGSFDEILGGGGPLCSCQDFDLQYRVYRAGLVTVLTPEVQVDHYGLRTEHEWPRTLSAYGVGVGGFYMKHARCGDPLAAWLLTRTIFHQTTVTLAKRLLRRPTTGAYLGGILRGLRQSFRFGVDHERRLYVVLPTQLRPVTA